MTDNITEKDRWIYFFKEGKNVDLDNPPEILCTDEMRQALEVLRHFSENEDSYALYQSRVEALSKENEAENYKEERGTDEEENPSKI